MRHPNFLPEPSTRSECTRFNPRPEDHGWKTIEAASSERKCHRTLKGEIRCAKKMMDSQEVPPHKVTVPPCFEEEMA